MAKTDEIIVAYEDAILFLTLNPTESYELDTGQSKQQVKRHNLDNLQTQLDKLYNRRTVFSQRLSSQTTINTPGW